MRSSSGTSNDSSNLCTSRSTCRWVSYERGTPVGGSREVQVTTPGVSRS